MNKRAVQTSISLLAAILFIWLALRTVDPAELWQVMKSVTFYWLPFFIPVLVFSHYLRAERWKLFLPDPERKVLRSTLFAGVMLGYLVNYLVPRLGELSRPVYVARKNGLSPGKLIGTIVAERLFDLFILLLLLAAAFLYYTGQPGTLDALFGIAEWSWYHYAIIPAVIAAGIGALLLFRRLLIQAEKKGNIKSPLLSKLMDAGLSFSDGLVSMKKVKSWPMFIVLTAGIWSGYVLMTFIPFFMLDLQMEYGLTLFDAVILTVASSVGVTIPTPAGIGSYHLVMQQTMYLLFDVPPSSGLTYATVLHIVNFLVILMIAPLSLWWDKYYTLVRD